MTTLVLEDIRGIRIDLEISLEQCMFGPGWEVSLADKERRISITAYAESESAAWEKASQIILDYAGHRESHFDNEIAGDPRIAQLFCPECSKQ